MNSIQHAPASIIGWSAFVVVLLLLSITTGCQQNERNEPAIAGGRADFQAYCASCHGREAKGNGPVAEKLQTRPPDLTLLKKKFGGVFPAEYIMRTIDGREELAAHGTRAMPVWGKIWRSENDPASEVETQRILQELLSYLESIQVEG